MKRLRTYEQIEWWNNSMVYNEKEIYEQESYDPFGEEKIDKILRMIVTKDGRRVFASDAKTDQEIINQMKKETGCGEADYGGLTVVKIKKSELLQIKRDLKRRIDMIEEELERANYEYACLFGFDRDERPFGF